MAKQAKDGKPAGKAARPVVELGVATDSGVGAEAEGPDARRRSPAEAVAEANVHAPTRGNRKLEKFLDAVNSDERVLRRGSMAVAPARRASVPARVNGSRP